MGAKLLRRVHRGIGRVATNASDVSDFEVLAQEAAIKCSKSLAGMGRAYR
jgi:hypothetical protein